MRADRDTAVISVRMLRDDVELGGHEGLERTWDQAVKEIDGEYGYSLEFSPDPEAQRGAYQDRAEAIERRDIENKPRNANGLQD